MAASKYKAFISYKHSEIGRRHAIALETGLKRYAKPLLSRPIKIFRDEKHMVPDNNLSELITNGLDQSEFMIFIAEKGAADSKWCKEELEYWCGNLNRKDRLIIVHAADILKLDIENNKIDWDGTQALPSLLENYISNIPLYVDLTWATNKEELDLNHVQYKSIINLVTAKLRGVAPEELNDVELRVHRKNIRLRNWAIGVLSIMLIISIFASLFARSQTIEAKRQEKNALQQEAIAKDSTISAQRQRSIAEAQTVIAKLQRDTAKIERDNARIAQKEAERQRDIAISGQLSALASNELAVDPSVSLALAIQAMQRKPTDQARQMLQTAFLQSYIRKIINGHSAKITNVGFLKDGHHAFSIGVDNRGFIWDLNNSAPIHQFEGYRGVVSQDEKYALTSVKDHNIALWNFENGEREAIFSGHTGTVYSLAISKDSKYLASGSTDKTVRIYDSASKKIVGTPINLGGIVTDLQFSPDGEYLAIGIIYNQIIIWDIKAHKILFETNGVCLDFSADGKWLATGGADESGNRIIDIVKREESHHFGAQLGSIKNISFSPDGKFIATTSSNNNAYIWTNKGQPVSTLSGHTNSVDGIDWSPDGNYLVTGSRDFTARVWSSSSDRAVAVLRGHKGAVPVVKFSPDGTQIISGSIDGEIRHWNISGTIPEMVTEGSEREVQQVAFLDRSNHAILAGGDGITQIWDLDLNQIIVELPGEMFCVSPNGEMLATAGEEIDINLWTLPDGNLIQNVYGNDDPTFGLAFSPDGKFLISSSGDDRPIIHELIQQFPSSNKNTKSQNESQGGIIFSPNGQYLVTSEYGQIAQLWQWPAMKEIAKMPHERTISATSFSHSGHLLATGSWDRTVGIWEIPSGKLKWRIRTKEDVDVVAFHPNDDIILVAVSSGNIEVWDLKSRRLITTLIGHSDGIYNIAISRNGNYMVSASNDHTAWLWDLKTWNPIRTFAAHGDAVWSITLSADGQKIMTGSEDGSAHIYSCEVCIPDDELLDKALNRLKSAPPSSERLKEVAGDLK